MLQPLIQPIVALMLLTMVVWIYMYVVRIGYIKQHRIDPQSAATPEAMAKVLPDKINAPSNNLKNLLELPVIFYVVCIFLLALRPVDQITVNLAWAYVALRAVHSMIHCTVNIVIWRFVAYFLSSLVLWLMVMRLAMFAFM
jgi:hypothetical protein